MGQPIHETTPIPMPSDWQIIYKALSAAWVQKREMGIIIPAPPVPLILAGASVSKASEIKKRWINLIEWANNYGLADIVRDNLGKAPEIDVAESLAGVSENGKGWWPNIGDQAHETKIKPSKEASLLALQLLVEKWIEVAGVELAGCTRPYKFTGSKYRRLIVLADPKYKPPWGSWSFVSDNPKAFSLFRRAVNDAISPLEVDTIDFKMEPWSKLES